MKTKLKIIIPIAIAAAAIILAVIFIQFKPNEAKISDNPFDLAQNYLVEQSYEQAIAEFEKAIELDPMNVDAYIGIAEAHEAIGNRDMAVEWLEKGFEATGDERLQEKIEELLNEDVEVAEVTTNTTEVMTITEVTTTVPETTTIETTSSTPVTTTSVTTTAKKQMPSSVIINGNTYSTDLTELYLSEYTLTGTDVENISYMKKLKKISFSHVQSYTRDFSPLGDLLALEELELIECNCAHYLLETKNNWSNLKKLISQSNEAGTARIKDISFISNYTNLEYLDLSGNTFDDLTPISELTNLTYLDVSSTTNWRNYRNLKPLAKLTNLKYLDLSLCNIKDITPLSELKNLEELNLAMNDIEDFNPIKSLNKLAKVGIFSNECHEYTVADDLKDALPDCTIYYSSNANFTFLD